MGRSPRPRPRPGAAAGALALLSLLLLSAAAGAGALQELDWFHEGLFGAEEALRAVQARHHWTRMLDLKLEEIINQLGRFEAIGPLGPRCLQPEILGSGPTGTRACGLSRISRELGDACVVVNVAALADPTDFVFEAAVAAAAPTCTVWSFDCLGRDRAPPAGGGDSGAGRIFSRKGCLGASTGPRPGSGLPVLSYADMRREMGMNESLPIALLRLDIEGWEYEALRAVVAAPGAANNAAPAEIALRLHFHVPGNATLGLPWRGSGASPPGAPEAEIVAADRDKETGEIALFIDHLWRSAGYYPVERTDSSAASPGSTELLLVRGPRHSEAYEDWADASAHGHAAHHWGASAISAAAAEHDHLHRLPGGHHVATGAAAGGGDGGAGAAAGAGAGGGEAQQHRHGELEREAAAGAALLLAQEKAGAGGGTPAGAGGAATTTAPAAAGGGGGGAPPPLSTAAAAGSANPVVTTPPAGAAGAAAPPAATAAAAAAAG